MLATKNARLDVGPFLKALADPALLPGFDLSIIFYGFESGYDPTIGPRCIMQGRLTKDCRNCNPNSVRITRTTNKEASAKKEGDREREAER